MDSMAFSQDAFERFLGDISQAFMARQFALWERRVRMPFSLITKVGPVTIRSRAALRENFDLYLQAMRTLGVDLIVREPHGWETCEDGTVLATYTTDLIGHGKRLVPPYTSTAMLHPGPEGWRMSAILNARGHHDWTGKHPSDSGD